MKHYIRGLIYTNAECKMHVKYVDDYRFIWYIITQDREVKQLDFLQ